jgi:hypothetical protein
MSFEHLCYPLETSTTKPLLLLLLLLEEDDDDDEEAEEEDSRKSKPFAEIQCQLFSLQTVR